MNGSSETHRLHFSRTFQIIMLHGDLTVVVFFFFLSLSQLLCDGSYSVCLLVQFILLHLGIKPFDCESASFFVRFVKDLRRKTNYPPSLSLCFSLSLSLSPSLTLSPSLAPSLSLSLTLSLSHSHSLTLTL